MKSKNLPQAPQEAGIDKASALREHRVEIVAGVFEPPLIQTNRKRHRALFGSDAEVIEQRGEVRIVLGVVDNEARIDGNARDVSALKRVVDLNRVGVPAEARVLFEKMDIGDVVERERRAKAGNAGADNGDFHCRVPFEKIGRGGGAARNYCLRRV